MRTPGGIRVGAERIRSAPVAVQKVGINEGREHRFQLGRFQSPQPAGLFRSDAQVWRVPELLANELDPFVYSAGAARMGHVGVRQDWPRWLCRRCHPDEFFCGDQNPVQETDQSAPAKSAASCGRPSSYGLRQLSAFQSRVRDRVSVADRNQCFGMARSAEADAEVPWIKIGLAE